MRRAVPCFLISAFFLLAGVSRPAVGQGRTDYFNVESPQVHPIEIARIGGHDYLLVCNTPDNSVEIWDTDETIVPAANRFITRVPVGLEPVSVRWVGSRSRFYVANFLGDSISSVFISVPSGPSSLAAFVLKTVSVTDEPLDITFVEAGAAPGITVPTLFVTHMTLDAYGEYHALTLAPVASGSERMDALVATGKDIDFDTQLDDIALKQPRTAALACDKLFILGFLGGNTKRYDFDLYSEDLASGTTTDLGGLGSTNWNMEFVDDNNLFITGAKALNASLVGEPAVAGAPTGFVKSMFYWVQNPCSNAPTILGRDVNLIPNLQQVPGETLPAPISSRGFEAAGQAAVAVPVPTTKPVKKGQALVQLTDLEALTDDSGTLQKVFFTAYGSDRVGIIVPQAGQSPINWPRRKININPVAAPAGSFVGPRGLALKGALAGSDTDPGDRLYVVNRGENSVTIIDPSGETVVDGFVLNNHPIPKFLGAGRKFLYSARLSGKGFVACASCHMDGRTDGLAWNLSDGVDVTIPPKLLPFPGFAGGKYKGQKGFIVTQSLQGLLNWGVPPSIQGLFSNAPYHWRGDRETFLSFNGAFASLLKGNELSDLEIASYEEFVNTIHYPPNPKQPKQRLLSGVLGDPDDNDPTQDIDGSGALLGLKIYHTVDSDGFSCVGCHALPEGSDNVLTENIAGVNPHPVIHPQFFANAPKQPMETAALRGLFQKEARLDRDGFSIHDNSPITGYEGMLHTGLSIPRTQVSLDFNGTASMNAFNARFFSSTVCAGPTQPPMCNNLQALNQFIHEFDFGSSPMIGESLTFTQTSAGSAATAAAFQAAEDQASLANASVAVIAQLSGVATGFWLDFSGTTALYRQEPGGGTFTRSALLGLITNIRDRMTLLSTPLGSEIRVAAPSGVPTVPTGPAPSRLTLLPMVPNTAHTDIPSLSLLWDTGSPGTNGTNGHTTRLYQNALLIDGPAGGFGLCSIRHEAPRRFRVAGRNIRHGATLRLFIQNDAGSGPPITSLRVDDPGQVPTLELELPIYPTGIVLDDPTRVWETAVELEPMLLYRLMTGRPNGFPGVIDNVTDLDFLLQIVPEAQPVGTWSPLAWNHHWVRVVNADGTQADGGWQVLSLEPGPDCP